MAMGIAWLVVIAVVLLSSCTLSSKLSHRDDAGTVDSAEAADAGLRLVRQACQESAGIDPG